MSLFPAAVRVGARWGNPCIVAFSAARGKAAPYAAVLHHCVARLVSFRPGA
ncbi:hypothetical protein SSKA14_2952 [Stenotrophomonas sp. SKA14]|nr:hypothetical protein SSKA14_2952 [Stenotrophomonas sp. SKA14]